MATPKLNLKAVKKSYGTDLKAEVEGKWFPLAMIDGVEVKVARGGNPNYKKALRRLYKPFERQIRRNKPISPVEEDRIQLELLVGTLLLDWRGMPSEVKGVEVPFSKEVARELLGDPELKELKDEVVGFSEEFEAFQIEDDEVLEKN